MLAVRLTKPGPIDRSPLDTEQMAVPRPGPGQILLSVRACAVCHTDLHLVEGEITPPSYPITPGHQVVGIIGAVGHEVEGWKIGDRAGVPWLHGACGTCEACRRGEENLCTAASFTGFHVDGGFAEAMLANSRFALPLPLGMTDEQAAPLLCAGIIGYRSLRKADVHAGETVGLIGFGASAHLAIQVARHWGCSVYVFTRGEHHRRLASQLGAAWCGGVEETAPQPLDRAVLFAPVGGLVPLILEKLRPGGTLAINAIAMSPIPEMPYRLVYGERTLRSVANATRQDGIEFLRLATEIPVHSTIRTYGLRDANRALLDLKAGAIDGAGVLLT
jgi:propanol-preferring alcohol dehydrogenase